MTLTTLNNFCLIILFVTTIYPQNKQSFYKETLNDNYNFISANRLKMWISNNGLTAPQGFDEGGLMWPGGIRATRTMIYSDGLVFTGKVDGQIRAIGSSYRAALQAGNISITGKPSDARSSLHRIYKIYKKWSELPPGQQRDGYEEDYLKWPMEIGAPYIDNDNNGMFDLGVDEPNFLGDEVLWFVANDFDSTRAYRSYRSLPLGLEIQTTVFAFDQPGPLGDMVFKKIKFINKSGRTIEDMYISQFSDPDIGTSWDDYSGCDTTLDLAYTYNSENYDFTFRENGTPAVGYAILQGPIVNSISSDTANFDGRKIPGKKNLGMSAFTFHVNSSAFPEFYSPDTTLEIYNTVRGLSIQGNEFINPITNQPTKFIFPGDPINSTGWYQGDGWPAGPQWGDVRHYQSSGPFTMSAGDTQEVVIAIFIGKGASHLASLEEVKKKALVARRAYNNNFKPIALPPAPELSAYENDQNITLWWKSNAEKFDEYDSLLITPIRLNINGRDTLIHVSDNSYTFEGYRLWQFKDLEGTSPLLLGVFDKKNSVKDIYHYVEDYIYVNGQSSYTPMLLGNDSGLVRSINILQDGYTKEILYNGTSYYFGVTAYAYSRYSDPPFVESEPKIIEVRPGLPPIDKSYSYLQGEIIISEKTFGLGDGFASFQILDPDFIKDKEYEIVMSGPFDTLTYSIIDIATGDTIAKGLSDFDKNYSNNIIIDGFLVEVLNVGADSLKRINKKSYVKDIFEVKKANGDLVSPPKNVLNEFNSNGAWKLFSVNPYNQNKVEMKFDVNWREEMGHNDYEIRFTPEGSEYYTTGYSSINPSLKNDPKGKGKLPFEVWQIDRYGVQKRLFIKVEDNFLRDSSWTKDDTSQTFESIYVYDALRDYAEPLSPTSGSSNNTQHKMRFSFEGSVPDEGTVISISTWKPLAAGDKFKIKLSAPTRNDANLAKQNLDKISVYPNPYFGAHTLESNSTEKFVTFTNLPTKTIIRIFSIAGIFIQKIEKDNADQYLKWDLRNDAGKFVGSGIYIAHIELPGIGTRIMKLAIIPEQQFNTGRQ